VLDAEIFTQRLLQLLMEGAVVGQNLVLPDLLKVGDKLLQRRQVRLGDEDRVRIHIHLY